MLQTVLPRQEAFIRDGHLINSGERTRLPPMWSKFKSIHEHHMWVAFVNGSLLCSRGFSLGTPVFPPHQKATFPNSNSTRYQVDKETLSGYATSKSLVSFKPTNALKTGPSLKDLCTARGEALGYFLGGYVPPRTPPHSKKNFP